MQITVEKRSDDGLSHELWRLEARLGYLVLVFYTEGTRETKRHGFKGEKWSSLDERTATLERPTEIPDWVIREAVMQISFNVAIGWSNDASVIGRIKISDFVAPHTQRNE